MIGSNYKAHRDNVLDLYKGYLNNRNEFDVAMNSAEGDGVDLKFLESRINNIKNQKFTVAVAGEVKAGKSTFINALLGEELMPSDVLQTTSAIVEIFKAENLTLKVKYGDNSIQEFNEPEGDWKEYPIRTKLQEICAIPDDYREIPTTLIDKLIINSIEELYLSDNDIDNLENLSSTKIDAANKELIRKYIGERPKNKIPVEIQIGYPFKWKFNELRVVDTPGVNAVGGIQDVSFSYFEYANAILFIHPIKPLESESFKKFIGKVISNRSRESLFLVLTHAGLHTESDIEKLHEEAIRMYNEFIPEERILVVDSLLQMIVHEFDKGKELQEIRKNEGKKKLLASFREKAEDEGRELKEIIKEGARFGKMISAIDNFSSQAPNLQLGEVLKSIKEGYLKEEKEYNKRIGLLQLKKQDPQKFEDEIVRISEKLKEYRLFKNETTDNINQGFTGGNAKWIVEREKLKENFEGFMSKSLDVESIRKRFLDDFEKLNKIFSDMLQSITDFLRKELQNMDKSFEEKHRITVPKVDLDSIQNEAKVSAFKKKDITEKRPVDILDIITVGIARAFRENEIKTGEILVFDQDLHVNEFRKKCIEEFSKVSHVLSDQVKPFIDNYKKIFSDSVDEAIYQRIGALEDIKSKKQSNESIMAEIDDLNKKKEDLPKIRSRVEELIKDLQ